VWESVGPGDAGGGAATAGPVLEGVAVWEGRGRIFSGERRCGGVGKGVGREGRAGRGGRGGRGERGGHG
jgi:hypothetical protein